MFRYLFFFSPTTTMDLFYPLIVLQSECINCAYTDTTWRNTPYIHKNKCCKLRRPARRWNVSQTCSITGCKSINLTEIPAQLKMFCSNILSMLEKMWEENAQCAVTSLCDSNSLHTSSSKVIRLLFLPCSNSHFQGFTFPR